MFHRFLLAISYVTCFHVRKVEYDQSGSSLSGLAKYLPSVGLLIGACLILSAMLFQSLRAPASVSAALLTTLWFVFTSGLHLDGLMDTADGIFSHQSKERMLEIMSDPRVGNFGVITGALLLICKFGALFSLLTEYPLQYSCLALAIIPAWARFAEVYAIGRFPYLREQGKGKIWHDTTAFPRDLFQSAVLPLVCTFVAVKLGGSVMPLSMVAITTIGSGLLTSIFLTKKLGGQTGDTYGAVVEIAEAAGLVTAAVIMC